MTSRDSESIATTFRFRFGPHLDVGQPQVESETWEDVKRRFKNQTRLPFFGAHLAGHSRTADPEGFAPRHRTSASSGKRFKSEILISSQYADLRSKRVNLSHR